MVPAEHDDSVEGVHPHQAVESDIRLMVLARFSDPEAIVQLWNRYFTAAYIAARAAGVESSRPTRVVATSFLRRLTQAEKQHIRISTFLAGWFQDVGAPEPPQAAQKAVSWAFYAMDEVNRSIVWHQYVDDWTAEQLVNDLSLDPGNAPGIIDQACSQFREFLTRSAALLDVKPVPAASDPSHLKATLISGLLLSTPEIVAEQGSPIHSAAVITPPLPSPRVKEAAMNSRTPALADRPHSRVPLPVKIVSAGFAAAVLAVGGIVAATTWNGDSPDSIANMVPSTSTSWPTPTHTVTPTPSPTPEDTETTDTETPSPDTETATATEPPPAAATTRPAAPTATQPAVPPPATQPVVPPPYTPPQQPSTMHPQPPVIPPSTQAPPATQAPPTTPAAPPATEPTDIPTDTTTPDPQSINPYSGFTTGPEPTSTDTVLPLFWF